LGRDRDNEGLATTTTTPNLPVPAGRYRQRMVAPTDFPEDLVRYLTWSKHDAGGVGAAVDGAREGKVYRRVSL
jgi:hypothetical protein